MTMENQPFEDVLPLKNGDFSILMLVFRAGNPFEPSLFHSDGNQWENIHPKKYISFLKIDDRFLWEAWHMFRGELLIWMICS